jgi:opacity protein-like surface antigen
MPTPNLSTRRLLCLAAVAAAGSTHAQQALFDGLTEGMPVPVGGTFAPGEKLTHWGPARITMGASYSCQYNDNVLSMATDRQWDFINTPMLNFGIYLPITDASPLQFSMGVGYMFYSRNTQLNRFTLTPSSALAWTIPLNEVSLTFYDNMSYTADPLQEPGLSGTGNFSTFQNAIGFRATWAPDRYVLTAGASYQHYLSTITQYEYINHHGPTFLVQAGYKITPKTQAGLDISVGMDRFTDPQRSDFNSYSFGPYLDWQVLDTLKLTARAGYALYDFAESLYGASQGSYDSYYVSLSLDHQLTKSIAHRLLFTREFSPGLTSALSQLAQNSAVLYSPQWQVTDYATLLANVGYDFGDNAVVGIGATYNRWGAGGGVNYSVTERLKASLLYQWYSKTSSAPNDDYQVNTVTLSAGYSF